MDLREKIEALKNSHEKLLLVIGHPGSGKSKIMNKFSEECGIPILDLDNVLKDTDKSSLLKEMKLFIKNYHHPILLLDNKNILYQKNNTIDLLSFLQELSHDIPIIASWNGFIEDGQIFHFQKNAPQDYIYSVDKEQFMYILC